MNLEEVPNPGDHLALPKEIIECAAGLSAKDNAVPKLTEAMSRIAAVSADVQASLNEIKGKVFSKVKLSQVTLTPFEFPAKN